MIRRCGTLCGEVDRSSPHAGAPEVTRRLCALGGPRCLGDAKEIGLGRAPILRSACGKHPSVPLSQRRTEEVLFSARGAKYRWLRVPADRDRSDVVSG